MTPWGFIRVLGAIGGVTSTVFFRMIFRISSITTLFCLRQLSLYNDKCRIERTGCSVKNPSPWCRNNLMAVLTINLLQKSANGLLCRSRCHIMKHTP